MDNDWNEFMRSKPVRIVMNGLVAVITAAYAVGGVRELLSPTDSSQLLMEQLGTTGFYALTVARVVVCLWVCVSFARMVVNTITGKDDERSS